MVDVERSIFEPEHEQFRELVRQFLRTEWVPNNEQWEDAGSVPRAAWKQAAALGLVGFEAPVEHGGLGLRDFRFNAVLDEEVEYAVASGDNFALQNDVLGPYLIELTNAEQQERWLPRFTSGDLIAAVAMTEPGAGSDLRGIQASARRTDRGYAISGAKTFITSGIDADLVVVVARHVDGPAEGRLSLFAVEAETPGFTRGRKLAKIGRRAQDTAELFFDECEIPAANLIGGEGEGLALLKRNLPQERLSIAVSAVAVCEQALEITSTYAKQRQAFGQPIGSLQANRFTLAEMRIRTDVARVYVDDCLMRHVQGRLSAERAAGAKWMASELQWQVVDSCLQLHGGYGYMDEYPISRIWRDSRVQRIYGGTSEVMKEIVGRAMGH